jgi:hypothetical protein
MTDEVSSKQVDQTARADQKPAFMSPIQIDRLSGIATKRTDGVSRWIGQRWQTDSEVRAQVNSSTALGQP